MNLPPPSVAASDAGGAAAERRRRWLGRVESLVSTAIAGAESRMWLCAAMGSLQLPSHAQRAAFTGLLSDSQSGRAVAERVARMLCDHRPSWAARILARDDRLLRRFFNGDSKRIEQWFGKFSMSGDTDHEWGARALARYTFVHRETCWHELEWKGKHGQAPATVASKPHYFLELDVVKTVDNFLDGVPSFWRSTELWDSMKDGEFLALDIDFFTKELALKLLADDCPETWRTVEDYLAEESFSTLSNGVLHLLSEETLLCFINELVESLSKVQEDHRRQPMDTSKDWLKEIVLSGEKCSSLADAIVCNACANYKRQILNIIRDEEHEEEANAMQELFSQVQDDATAVWSLRWEGLTANRWISVKWLALEGWFLYAYLSCNWQRIEYASFLRDSGIDFEASQPQVSKKRSRKQRKKGRKRHKGSPDSLELSSEEEADCEDAWKLSTDRFSVTWRKEDLPEHLSSYAFGKCLTWAVSYW